jgi:NADPH:quinone reductase-like Zn-dependent oxidoreductase
MLGNSKQTLTGTGPYRTDDLNHLVGMLGRDELRRMIDRSFRLEDMAAAHAYVDSGNKIGNVPIIVS